MELADFLIWGGLTIIVLRFIIPLALEWFGFEVTKTTKTRDGKQD